MSDDLIFQEGGIVVSKTLVRVGAASYPINRIASVSIRRPVNKWLLGLAIVCVLIGIAQSSATASWLGAGAVLVGASFSPSSQLILKTTGGDITLLASGKKTTLRKIKAAIEQAMTQRG